MILQYWWRFYKFLLLQSGSIIIWHLFYFHTKQGAISVWFILLRRADLAFSSLRPDRTLTLFEGCPLVKRLKKWVLGLGAPKLRSGSVPVWTGTVEMSNLHFQNWKCIPNLPCVDNTLRWLFVFRSKMVANTRKIGQFWNMDSSFQGMTSICIGCNMGSPRSWQKSLSNVTNTSQFNAHANIACNASSLKIVSDST